MPGDSAASRTVGLIGGMSWESSAEYYRILNELARERLGGAHSCPCLLHSLDFAPVEELQHQGRWDELRELMTDSARALARAGAQGLAILTNTMHVFADEVERAAHLPLIHIADAAGAAAKAAGMTRVGLLGTRFTMERDFYSARLAERFGLDVVVPGEADRALVHRVIYEELVLGRILDASRRAYVEVIERLGAAGARGVILGCTEIPLLVRQMDSPLPLFDTTRLHAEAIADFCLGPAARPAETART